MEVPILLKARNEVVYAEKLLEQCPPRVQYLNAKRLKICVSLHVEVRLLELAGQQRGDLAPLAGVATAGLTEFDQDGARVGDGGRTVGRVECGVQVCAAVQEAYS